MPTLPDPVDLRPDGTVQLLLGRGTVTLRRPLIGELRDLLESLENSNDQAHDVLLDIPPLPSRPPRDAEPAVKEAYRQERAESRVAAQKALAEADALRGSWMRKVVETLGDKPWPDLPIAELPTWVASIDVAVALTKHWQAVPLGRGGQ